MYKPEFDCYFILLHIMLCSMKTKNLFSTFLKKFGLLFLFIAVGLFFDSTFFIAFDKN